MTLPLTKFSSVVTLSTSRTADPLAAGIGYFATDELEDAVKVWDESNRGLAQLLETMGEFNQSGGANEEE